MPNRRSLHWMGNRRTRFHPPQYPKFSATPSRSRSRPIWVYLSVLANICLLALLVLSATRLYGLSVMAPSSVEVAQAGVISMPPPSSPAVGQRKQLNYQQWVEVLTQEAIATAEKQPDRLTILLGDSISLWFPPEFLPSNRTWLNQGISGETSTGLLKRLDILDQTRPDTIFLMIGINDLLRGTAADTILANQQDIIRYLKQTHPQTKIVVQSILPHAAEQATWEGRDRLLKISNTEIRGINAALAAIAQQEGAYFLNLNPLFSNDRGELTMTLSTDGLHLNQQGYLVWRSALELYEQLILTPRS